MSVRHIDSKTFSAMLLTGAHHLSNNANTIDALNVFPVPDGDTGTNMNLTITAGAKAVQETDSEEVGQIAASFAKGLLMGARGNSGVILSQLFRGFGKALEGKSELTAGQFANALDAGTKTAYKAVMKPVEGTILTVAKDAAAAAVEKSRTEADPVELFRYVVEAAKQSLSRTPDLLPVLKEVGVVDSGGQGLVTIYEGFLASLTGEELPEAVQHGSMDNLVSAEHHKQAQDFLDTADITFGYCTEFMVKLESDKLQEHPFDEQAYREELNERGDSLLVVADEDVVKVHIHTEFPGDVMTYSQQYGSLINMKIENMREQHAAIVGKKETAKERKQHSIVTVAMGDGVKALFESLGANVVISGGQTMNPSTQDIADAIQEANADAVYILPNNKNITMAAEQAAEMADTHAFVIPTKTIPQGMRALLAYDETQAADQNAAAMKDAMTQVKSGQVTHAVRDTTIEGVNIKEGQYIAILEGKIISAASDAEEALELLLRKMVDEEDELITIIRGDDASASSERLESLVEEEFPDSELEIHDGNQPVYTYLVAVE
ncbi:DAK2 domain-containing protein [Terribacillus sp. DMT04]|uniref:DAK2 domain-containing protein n=1 Tax=Terribacillus sp. DMT04 TaxID=2850441 RepID=UPI001C2BCC0C|nr:DAK2 domain-containing protein [Terribacillus sp. DMT04]QXE03059.1 DAK2 domain-containing protein [Terribacillus sp. DMT04]